MNGVIKLIEKYGRTILNDYDVIVTEAFFWRSRDEMCTKFLKLLDRVHTTRYPIETASTCLTPGLRCYFPSEPGCMFRCIPRDGRPRRVQPLEALLKEKPRHFNANETSIITVINESERKCDVVLTGDSTTKEILPRVEGKDIGIFQVPHHGSSSNSRLVDKCKIAMFSAQFDLSFIRDDEVKEIALFYSSFRAHCYVISAGGTESYKHPHSSVLQGIILASSLRHDHQECVILLTNSRGLDSKEKLKQLHQLVPEWTRYVKIYHYDDVFFTEQYYTSLRPEKCIDDVRASTIEWTPEGYVNRTRIMIPVKITMGDCRPLEKDRFVIKSLVEITVADTLKFNAHVICVPLPHNPRSGDSINCCYVIEESIPSERHYSQVLFLINSDERIRSLSRAKKYNLFQYVNNEWQMKQLPATVLDCEQLTLRCNIPYDRINSLWPVHKSWNPPQPSPSLFPYHKARWPDSGEATAVPSKHSAGVLQQVEMAKGQSIPKSSPTRADQYPQPKVSLDGLPYKGEFKVVPVSPTKNCGCRTGCATNKCGCRRRGSVCGTSCKCIDCKNNHQYAFCEPETGQPQVQASTTHKSKGVVDHAKVVSPTKRCGCKTGCATRRCGCKKQGLSCGRSCSCCNCKNC